MLARPDPPGSPRQAAQPTRIAMDWKLLASTELFQIDLGFAQGFVSDNRLAIEHDLFDHAGWGLALNAFTLDAEIEDSPLTADIEYAYQGLLLYLRFYL